MKTEFEAKFFPISKNIFRKLLKQNGAYLKQKETLMRRVIYQLADGQLKKWLRVRDEGNKTTITIKEIINPNAIDGVREIEINTDDFQKTRHLFDVMGLTLNSYQENYREVWELDGAIITIDTWPGLDPVLEIESTSAEHVKEIIKMLNLDENDALYGAVDTLYQMKYGISSHVFNSIQHVAFETIDSIMQNIR
ncbi:MAG: CYTH domain-containing protein [Candidatus Dependentiae bacterium]|nr:CYTH domain-containing protein [Candidatus Dependentiae bacterium]